MKNLFNFGDNSFFSSKFIYRVELNQSIVEHLQKKQKEVDDEQRLRDAERIALHAMPDFGRNMIDDIENKWTIEGLKKSVRNRIFNVLETGHTSPIKVQSWVDEKYHKTISAIKENRIDTKVTVENVKRADQLLSSLQTKYDRMAQDALAKKDSTNAKKRWIWPDKISDHQKFDENHKIVLDVFDDIKKQIEDRKKDAESYRERAVQQMKEGFHSLKDTPAQQTRFLELVEDEIKDAKTPPATPHFESAGTPYEDLVNGIPLHHRLEAYKYLDWDTSHFKQATDTLEKDKTELQGNLNTLRTHINGLNPDFGNIREYMKDVKAGSEVPPLPGLLKEVYDYITEYGSIDRTGAFATIYENQDIDDYGRFLILSNFLGTATNADITKNMHKDLKQKFLGYLNNITEN